MSNDNLVQATASKDDKQCVHLIAAQLFLTTAEIIEVGRELLPYFRDDLSQEQIGEAAHDAAHRLARLWKARIRALPNPPSFEEGKMAGIKLAAVAAFKAAEAYRNKVLSGDAPILNRAHAFALDGFAITILDQATTSGDRTDSPNAQEAVETS